MEVISLLSEPEIAAYLATHGRPSRPQPPYPLTFPAGLVDRGARHLQANGQRELEQLVLWSGYPIASGVMITALLLPETEATWGWVHILPAEQPKIVDWLHTHRQLLFAEAHTHGDGPRATEMSDEDRRHPAGRQDGFLTIIVPSYASRGIDFLQTGVWECQDLVWHKLGMQEVRARLHVIDDREVRHALQ